MTRPRQPLPWGMLGPVIGLVLLAMFALATSGCALSPMDRAVLSANAAATVGEQGRDVLHDACTLRYQDALDRATLARVDAWCIPAGKALAAYRAAWIALSAAIAASQAGGDVAAIAGAVQRMAAAGTELATTLARSSEVSR